MCIPKRASNLEIHNTDFHTRTERHASACCRWRKLFAPHPSTYSTQLLTYDTVSLKFESRDMISTPTPHSTTPHLHTNERKFDLLSNNFCYVSANTITMTTTTTTTCQDGNGSNWILTMSGFACLGLRLPNAEQKQKIQTKRCTETEKHCKSVQTSFSKKSWTMVWTWLATASACVFVCDNFLHGPCAQWFQNDWKTMWMIWTTCLAKTTIVRRTAIGPTI